MSIYKNPYTFFIPINDRYVLAVNPTQRDSVRLFNISQYELLKAIDNTEITQHIADNQNNEHLQKFLGIILQDGFVNTTNIFEFPKFSSPQSLSLWIHTTDACNLRCKYCYIHTKDTNINMSEDVIEALSNKIVQTVVENNLKRVILRLSGGEPFLNYKIWDIYFVNLKEKLLKHDCELRIVFLTNFTLITNEIIEFIKKHNISISGSIDGIGKYNDQTRVFKNGVGAFNNIDKGIKKLLDASITPFLMTVVSNNNLEGLPKFTEFVISENLSMRFSIVQHDSFNYEKALPIFQECYVLFEKAIENGYAFSKKHKLCDLHLTEFHDRTCSCGRNAGTIYTNGDIYFCQQQVGGLAKLGNVFDSQNLINTIVSGDNYNGNLNEECFSCQYQYICSGGCPLARVNDKSESCDFYHKIIPTVYRLIGLERLKQISDLKIKNEMK